jgi:cytochrome c-type biogenesis protein CcmH
VIVFWAVAALLAAALTTLVLAFAARGRAEAAVAPDSSLYTRQLEEIEALHARGLLGEAERTAARAETARRLLAAEDRGAAAFVPARGGRTVLLAAVLGAPLLAGAVYLAVGSPGRADAPYAQRLAGWRAADPARLPAPALAALAQSIADERPTDPDAWRFLGRARLQSNEGFAAVRALERAAQLGGTAEDYATLGEALAAFNGGEVDEQAAAAFAEAVRRNPASVPARYGVAQGLFARGDAAGGRAALAALAASLPVGDARRLALEAEVKRLQSSPAPLP